MAQDKTEKMTAHDEKARPRVATRFAASLPGAVGALIIASAVALGGSTLASFRTDAQAPDTDGTGTGSEVVAASAKGGSVTMAAFGEPLHDSFPQAEARPKPSAAATPKATEQAAPKATEQPAPPAPTAAPVAAPLPPPAETPKPIEQAPPNPVVSHLTLDAWVNGDRVKLSWTPFWGEGFAYYKLVRSIDADVAWPMGGDDQLIGAIGKPDESFFADKPPCGIWYHYRVFAVRAGANGYEVLAASNTAGGGAECPPAPPATVGIGLTAAFADGKVNLAWQPCAVEGFVAYKVVRSKGAHGAEVIAAIGDPNATAFSDGAVHSGETWSYRVMAKADLGHGGFIACESPTVTVTIP